jgi:hypothetical protein
VIGAQPVAASAVENRNVVSTPRLLKFSYVSLPKMSSPTFPTMAVFAPSLAAMTHWLAPGRSSSAKWWWLCKW